MNIQLKEGQVFGYGYDEDYFTVSNAKTVEELIDEAVTDLYDEDNGDEQYATLFVARKADKKAVLQRAMEIVKDELDDVLWDMSIPCNDESCQVTVDDELLDILMKKVKIPCEYVGDCFATINLKTKEVEE